MILEKTFIKKLFRDVDNISFKVKFKDNKEMDFGQKEPEFTVFVNEPLDKRALMRSTSLALGESYMDKVLDVEGDLFKALDIVLSKMDEFTVDQNSLKSILFTSNSAKNQKEEVSSHYDIGNDFYKLWLDDTMNYSCAYFKSEDKSLYEAQCDKVDYIIDKLHLEEGMSLLDVGCGWGGLLIAAAKKYKIHGLGITLSQEQYDEFKERIKKEGLEDYLDVKLMDYREFKKSNLSFDRVVSVGMIEHVGRENYDLFLENIDHVLKKKGILLLHFISGRKESLGDPWIRKYIFPGGVIPSLREVISKGSEKNFYTVDIESLRRHYVKTLLCWYENFNKEVDTISKMFDERFIRMWKLYLASCAAGFNNGVVDLHQIIFSKGVNNDLSMTRDYLYR
ncbi:cyclopropane-fatty-acyl-phospholipid synthase Cfa [Gottschalkia acidurici 9a]|uniref:Cyclopropane-fatty-acyl-phospholipid synthase Cfa n=1 Tax=Gottschalkia acidurici (strain ATCC 7906 / DSM 604 / BCRC 14475 / CIP 104303 / KCTC 5404 / NCIMB 10678 / 9a) TaxID=1128398 RepID=K0B3L6_GOTA9|nr:cyclopropane-fatty-acyl-phospholipid synthase family protein [Gottschalkia acidurici]AFS79450.1 cyclopropane-fatty-acyl-phospholipid synthase Cfa [Gottschalkia acidurici 9a]